MDWHRNGVSGLGFHVAIAEDPEAGGDMLVVRFQKDADEDTGQVVCAAFSLDGLDEREIRSGCNNWRGDHYSQLIDDAVDGAKA
jgi:hypothetical protein